MIKRILLALFTVVALVVVVALAMTFLEPSDLWAATHAFPACPSRPSCVSSLAQDPVHGIAPLAYVGDPAAARADLEKAVRAMPRTRIDHATPEYLHAVFMTPTMRYHDDLELLVEPGGVIQVRSISRFGYRDMGVNRERVEMLREATAHLSRK